MTGQLAAVWWPLCFRQQGAHRIAQYWAQSNGRGSMCVPLPKAQRLPFAARQHDRTDEACHIRTHLALLGMVGVLGMAGVDAAI